MKRTPRTDLGCPRRLSWDDIATLREAGLDALAEIGERYLLKRTWRTLWRKPVRPEAKS